LINEKEKDLWFYNLEDSKKQEILENIYIGEIIYDLDNDWKYLDWKIKLEAYMENNP
jgi:hypothetical protein